MTIIANEACPTCREQGRDKTGNHLMVFADGGRYCNRCKTYVGTQETGSTTGLRIKGTVDEYDWVSALPYMDSRSIRPDIAEIYGVRSDDRGSIFIPLTTDLTLQGYKVKQLDGKYSGLGQGKSQDLFGQHLIRSGGNKIFITEGECDAMAVAQVLTDGMDEDQKKKYGFPTVVSIPHGVGSAKHTLGQHRKLLGTFKQVVLIPDTDEAGKGLLQAAAEVLDIAKIAVVSLPLKDPNEMLEKGRGQQLRMLVLTGAKPPAPESLIWGDDISYEQLTKPIPSGYGLPQYPGLTAKLRGIRAGPGAGELTVICSGSGMGKTTYTHEWAWAFRRYYDLRLGQIRLEETVIKSAQALIAVDNSIPLALLRSKPSVLSKEQWEKSKSELLDNHRVAFLDHFGSLDSNHLVDHFKFLSYSAGCQVIFLDHISMVVSGQNTTQGERKDIDMLMTNLASFVEQSGTSVVAVVHLKRPEGDKSYNDGHPIGLSSLRGSAGLEQMSHNVIAIEGNQSGDKPDYRYSKILKSREWGDIGFCDTMVYNKSTGRLLTEL